MESLEKIIQERRPKKEILEYLHINNLWDELPNLLFNEDAHLSWRATWLLSLADDPIVQVLNLDPHRLITHGKKCPSSQKREILRLLEKLEIPEALLGTYFDWTLEMWTDLKLKSSLRVTALQAMSRVGKLFPELNREIMELNIPELLNPLTPAIKKQAVRIFQTVSKKIV